MIAAVPALRGAVRPENAETGQNEMIAVETVAALVRPAVATNVVPAAAVEDRDLIGAVAQVTSVSAESRWHRCRILEFR